MTTKGVERVNSASPDSRSPARQSQNFVGQGLNPTASNPSGTDINSKILSDPPSRTFMEQNSPIHARQGDDMERDTSPRVDLEPLANASR